MVEQATKPDEVHLKLYGLLVDQLQKYTAILWQFPMALFAANGLVLDKFVSRPQFLIAATIVDFVFAYAFHRLVLRQKSIIKAARAAESTIRDGVTCSPKPDPGDMRVPTALEGQETLDVRQTAFGGTDHRQAA